MGKTLKKHIKLKIFLQNKFFGKKVTYRLQKGYVYNVTNVFKELQIYC